MNRHRAHRPAGVRWTWGDLALLLLGIAIAILLILFATGAIL